MVAGYFIMITSTVSVDLKGLEKFEKDVVTQLNGANGPAKKALKLWAVRYRSYVQLRFDTYSKGGGNWRALSAATIKTRRKGRGKKNGISGTFTILRDTGTLFAALAPIFTGAPGAIEEEIPFGIRVGFGGPQKYVTGKKTKASIADIASFHQNGVAPRLPQREIIVPPNAQLLETMADDMTKALNELAG